METVIMHPKNKEQLTALKAIAKALSVDFEVADSPYNAAFVEKIQKSTAETKIGRYTALDPKKTLWENLE